MEFSEQSQRLADTTYRNIEELMVDMKGLMTAANTLHKAMNAVSAASDEFSFILQSIGAKATRLPGAVSKLGECLTEMVSGHRTIRTQYSNWADSLQTDLIFPLEEKLERDTKIYAKEHKQFKQETSKKESKTDKTASKLKSMQKRKISREVMEKENELRQMLADRREDLHATRVQALRNALIEERKIYCFLVERMCSVTHSQITYNAVSHQELSTKVMGWIGQCSHPNELPPESASLLRNPRSPNAFHPSSTTDVSDVHYDGFTADTPEAGEVTTADIRRYKMQASPSLQLNKGSHQNCRVRAIYPHQATTPEKLQFNTGDLIDAVDDTKQGWLYGTHTTTGKAGWFPAQYVSKIWPTPEPQRRRQGVVSATSAGTPPARPSPLTIVQVPERDYRPASSPTHQAPYNPPLPSPSPPPPPAAAAADNNSDSEEGQSGFASLIAAAARKKSMQN